MASLEKPAPRIFDWLTISALATTILFWASAFAAIRIGVEHYDPRHVALLRFGTASLVMIVYALITRMRMPHRADLPRLLVLGFVGITVYHTALNYGERTVSAGVASFLIATAPIFVAFLAITVLDERLSRWGWVGIAASFCGVSLIALNGENGFALNTDALLIVVSALAQAFFVVMQKPLLVRYGGLRLATYAIWAGTLIMLLYLPGFWGAMQAAPWDATAAVVYMGVFPGAVAYVAYSYALSRMNASRAASFLYVIPVVATLIAWLWLGEVPALVSLFGGLLVLAGVIVVNVYGKVR